MANRADVRRQRRRAERVVLERLEVEALRVDSSDADDEHDSDSSGNEPIENIHRDEVEDNAGMENVGQPDGGNMEADEGENMEADEGVNMEVDENIEGDENIYEVVQAQGNEVYFENDEDREEYLLNSLKSWAQKGIKFSKVDEMLKILKPLHNFVPVSHKTLLKTPRKAVPLPLGVGKFWYKGIQKNLEQRLTQDYFNSHDSIIIDVNIDGMEPFPSSCDSLWVILGRLADTKEPFIIAIYHGPGKLSDEDLEGFLTDYVEEVAMIIANGINMFGNNYPFSIRNYILDAVARAYIKCIRGHNSLFSCEKCESRGVWFMGRHIYLDINAPLRTDESFHNRRNPLHHSGASPLEAIPTNMVSSFRLDSMHLVHGGVVKRWLKFVLGTSGRRGKLTADEVQDVNNLIVELDQHIPSEFNRRPRPFSLIPKFRMSEFRRVIMYDGLVLFKRFGGNLWKSFILLYCGIRILNDPTLVISMTDIANLILREFITHAQEFLGPQFVVYNVHALAHMSEECSEHGVLDSFAAFPYESYLGVIKTYLRSPCKPLEQIMNRDFETEGRLLQTSDEDPDIVSLTRRHDKREENIEGVEYSKIKLYNFCQAVSYSDGCFQTQDGAVMFLGNIVHTPDSRILLVGHKFRAIEDFFEFPINSSVLGIYAVGDLDPAKTIIDSSQILRKCVLLPYGDGQYVSVPLMHTKDL